MFDKLAEEIVELRSAIEGGNEGMIQEEIGDILFTIANIARKLEVNAEEALHAHAYRDAALLFERALPHVGDVVERSRLMCRTADAYWYNTEPAAAKPLLEQAIADAMAQPDR